MSHVLIALLPAVPGQQWSWRETAAELMAYGHRVTIVKDPPEAAGDNQLDLAGAWVAHCALALAAHDDRPPMLLVAPGSAGRMLPALGFSQRASRRRVAGYVLVDADLPKPGVQDWPDAPVTYVGGPGAKQARLRGWDVESGGDVARAIRVVAERWA